MEKKNKQKWKSAAPAAAVILLAAIALAVPLIQQTDFGIAADSTGKFKNLVTVEITHPSCADFPDNPKCDQPSEVFTAWNTITNEGKNFTRDMLSNLAAINAATNNWTVLEWSTDAGAPAATDSACPSPVTTGGLTIARGAVTAEGTGNYTVTKTWTASGTVSSVVKLCLSNNTASASSDLMGSAAVTTFTVVSGDTVTGNYSVALV